MSARVSIALATFNGERFLPEQLDSLACQTVHPAELVVRDDGSQDGTLAILERFAAIAPFRVSIEPKGSRLGPAGNFARAIARCAGDWVLPCDQDDRWHPDKIARLIAFADERPGALLLSHDAAIVDHSGSPSGVTLASQIASAGRDPAAGLVAGCCMAIARPLADMFDPPPRTSTHDAWIAALGERLGARAFLAEPLIDYRRHGANVSQSYMSRTRRSGPLARWGERVKGARRTPADAALRAAVEAQEDMVAALARHRVELVEALGSSAIAAAEAELETRIIRDGRRLRVHNRHGAARLLAVFSEWRNGTYRGCDGQLSMIRDLAG